MVKDELILRIYSHTKVHYSLHWPDNMLRAM